ncbi:MAG: tetratricopeptide repeat protein [Bacteroidales bacterium]|nr:tetratricopeptide repeat protein [Bacteroidales bacterium]
MLQYIKAIKEMCELNHRLMSLLKRGMLAWVVLCIASCGGKKELASSAGSRKIERKPMVETTDERLKSEAMLIDAKMKQELGKESEAYRQYSAIIGTYPDNDAAYYELSRLYAQNGMIDSAIAFANKAVELSGDNVWYMLNVASLYRFTKQSEAAIKTWERIVSAHPETLEYYYELSDAYLNNGDVKGAIAVLNRVEKKVGVTATVSTQKAKLWSHIGKEDKAMQELEALARTLPNDSKYNAMLAEHYMNSGNYAKAKECYDRVLKANPDDEYIHISLAEYYKTTKQPEKAYEELKIALAQKNLSTTNKMQILTNFYSKEEFYGKYSKYGYELLEVAMRGCDDSTSFAAFYGDVLMRQKKYDEAVRWFEKSISADSSDYGVWEALLITDISMTADTTVLRNHATRAIRLFPLNNLPYYALSVVEHVEGNYDEAIRLMKRCESLGFPNGYLEAETYNLLAECYNRTDDTLCYAYYERYLKIRPDDPDALNSYAYRLAIDKRNLEKAELMSRKSLKIEPDNPYYLDTYAWVLHQMGRDAEALKYIERAMQRDGESDEVREHFEAIKQGATK